MSRGRLCGTPGDASPYGNFCAGPFWVPRMQPHMGFRWGQINSHTAAFNAAPSALRKHTAWLPPRGPRKGELRPKLFWTFRGPEKEDVKFVLHLFTGCGRGLQNPLKHRCFPYLGNIFRIEDPSSLRSTFDLGRPRNSMVQFVPRTFVITFRVRGRGGFHGESPMVLEFRQIDVSPLLPLSASISFEVDPAVNMLGSKLTLAQPVMAPLAQGVSWLNGSRCCGGIVAQCRRRPVPVGVLMFAVTLLHVHVFASTCCAYDPCVTCSRSLLCCLCSCVFMPLVFALLVLLLTNSVGTIGAAEGSPS